MAMHGTHIYCISSCNLSSKVVALLLVTAVVAGLWYKSHRGARLRYVRASLRIGWQKELSR